MPHFYEYNLNHYLNNQDGMISILNQKLQ